MHAMDREIPEPERRRRRWRRAARWAALGAAGALALALGLGWLRPGVARAELRLGSVERRDLAVVVDGAGTVVPARETLIAAPVEARLVRALARPGDRLAAGTAIVELDLSEARSDLGRREDRVRQLGHERRRLELELDRELADLERRLAGARLDLERASVRRDRAERLAAEGLYSDEGRLEARVELEKARLDVEQLERAVASELESRAERLEGATLEIAIAAKERDELARRIARAGARAERDASLTWVLEREGESVRPGDPIARLADLSAFRVEATAAAYHAPRLVAGLATQVRLGDELLTGRVARVDPTLEAGAVRFTVELDRPDHPALRAQARVDLTVAVERREQVLTVARGFGAEPDSLRPIYVLRDGALVRQPVRFGAAGRDRIEVVSGLEPGDEIVLSDLSAWEGAARLRLR